MPVIKKKKSQIGTNISALPIYLFTTTLPLIFPALVPWHEFCIGKHYSHFLNKMFKSSCSEIHEYPKCMCTIIGSEMWDLR